MGARAKTPMPFPGDGAAYTSVDGSKRVGAALMAAEAACEDFQEAGEQQKKVFEKTQTERREKKNTTGEKKKK